MSDYSIVLCDNNGDERGYILLYDKNKKYAKQIGKIILGKWKFIKYADVYSRGQREELFTFVEDKVPNKQNWLLIQEHNKGRIMPFDINNIPESK